MRRSGPRQAQLRPRVLAGVMAVTLIALAAFDFAAVTALRGYLVGQADAGLQTVLSAFRPGELSQLGQPPSQLPAILDQYGLAFVPPHGTTDVVFASTALALDGPEVRAARPRADTVTSFNGQAQVRLLARPEDGGMLVADTSLTGLNQTIGQLELILAAGSAAAGALIFLGVAWVMRRGLRPLETMAAQAGQITAGDLTGRVSPHDPGSEVGRLGAALNAMLARIEGSVRELQASQELARRFFADASHELRTPLASLRANAELYQQGALPAQSQVDQAMHRIAWEAQRMSALVDDMLGLARLDQHPGQQHDPVDLTAMVTECAERAQITDPGRAWQARILAGLVVIGDEELLRRAVDNLLANVRAHTPAGTAATITAATRASSVIIEVSDDGPGVPDDQLPRIFDRFYRAASSPRRGSGLGLAIVAAIAAAHDGSAEATVNKPHGLRVTLTLPRSIPPGPGSAPAGNPPSPPADPGSP
jgi:two-component system, OmpR family, sensor kinase